MVVTAIFHLSEHDLANHPASPIASNVYEEHIADDETLVAVRAENMSQAKLVSDLLSQAGAEEIDIDAEAA